MIALWAAYVWASGAWAGTEVITGFRLRACAERTCVLVEAPESRRSPLDHAYVFRGARVTVVGHGAPQRVFDVRSGYYDPDFGYLIMHGQGLVNLTTGRVTLVANQRRP